MLHSIPKLVSFSAVVIVLIILKRFADRHSGEQFDERQILYRQKAYSNAAWMAIVFNIFVFIEGDSLAKYLSQSFVGVATLFLLVGVFAVSSIYYDAYFAPRKKKSFVVLYGLTFFLQLGVAILQWRDGDFLRHGQLYLTVQNATCALFAFTFGIILLVTAYMTWKEKHEVEE